MAIQPPILGNNSNGKPKSVSYLRVSGKSQVDGDGFPRQRECIARYASSQRIELVDEYRDEGVSGSKELADRQGLAALFDRVESNGIRIVIVERADRLARDLMVGEIILTRFRELGVRVIAAESGIDLTANDDDPTRVLIRQVLGAVAQFEKSVIVLKLLAARDRMRRRDGRCEGRKPFGARPGEAEIIDRILLMRRGSRHMERMSFAKIATALNASGVPTRQGGVWQPGTVYQVVRDNRPRLTGGSAHVCTVE
jgi:DNA invertase Pin-like site-specific DNA recombinase